MNQQLDIYVPPGVVYTPAEMAALYRYSQISTAQRLALTRHDGMPVVEIDGIRVIIGFDVVNYCHCARELATTA